MEKLKNYKVDNVYYSEYFDKETNRTYIGKAICHEEDKDFESDKIGYTISTNRAIEKYYKGLREEIEEHKEEIEEHKKEIESLQKLIDSEVIVKREEVSYNSRMPLSRM